MSKASALSTLGKVTPATRAKAEELWEYCHSKGYDLTRLWGMGPGDEHGVGRALDLMITGKGLGKDVGDLIASYLWKNRQRLGEKWHIWYRRIRSTSPGKSGNWTSYSGPSAHTDHVHVFFGTGGYVPPAGAGAGGGGTVTKTVDLSKIIAAAQRDSGRKQGGTTSGASASVKIVEDALRREGLLSTRYASDGSFGTYTVKAYAAWQRELGYSGRDADGIPGRASLEKLGRKYNFKVVS